MTMMHHNDFDLCECGCVRCEHDDRGRGAVAGTGCKMFVLAPRGVYDPLTGKHRFGLLTMRYELPPDQVRWEEAERTLRESKVAKLELLDDSVRVVCIEGVWTAGLTLAEAIANLSHVRRHM